MVLRYNYVNNTYYYCYHIYETSNIKLQARVRCNSYTNKHVLHIIYLGGIIALYYYYIIKTTE